MTEGREQDDHTFDHFCSLPLQLDYSNTHTLCYYILYARYTLYTFTTRFGAYSAASVASATAVAVAAAAVALLFMSHWNDDPLPLRM